ncbi:hypothetical protein [Pedococcus sp. P5_B7]
MINASKLRRTAVRWLVLHVRNVVVNFDGISVQSGGARARQAELCRSEG